MLSEDTTDCLALANTAILMRLIDELMERAPSLDPPPSSRMPCAICKAARNGRARRRCRQTHPQGVDAEDRGFADRLS